jgi:hypothetical protein
MGRYILVTAIAIGTMIFAIQFTAWKSPIRLLPAATVITLVSSLAYWEMYPQSADPERNAAPALGLWDILNVTPSSIAPLPLVAFAVIIVAVSGGFVCSPRYRRYALIISLTVFAIAGCLFLIDLSGYRPDRPILLFLAHHWGAYIGSAIHLRAGLVPLYDVPLQYGLGPALMIAATCGDADCWAGMESVVILMNMTYGLLILRMVLATDLPRGLIWHLTATVVVFAAVFVWPGTPAYGAAFLATPSFGALRFLPVTLVAFLLFFGRHVCAAVALAPAILWSPESAAMSIAVFGLSETVRVGITRAFLRSAGLMGGTYVSLVLLHRTIFHIWMDPMAVAEYLLHLPGGSPPIVAFSNAPLVATVLGIGGWLTVWATPDQLTAHRDRTATFLLFAATIYWLGESHPSKVCNLAPFLVLVAFRVLDRPAADRSLLTQATHFGLATSVAALALSPWHSIPYGSKANLAIQSVVATFTWLDPDVEQIRKHIINPDGLGIADFGPTYTRHISEKIVWTPLDPSSLWSYVPSERRKIYVQRSSARLRRSGWAIIEDDQRLLYDDLLAGYTVAQQHSVLGSPSALDGTQRHYVVACFDPRPDITGSIVGPSCPPERGMAN